LTASGTDSEERLRVEAAQKDPARFAELYEIHFPFVYAFVARRVRDRERAQDITADVFHRALSALPRFEWRGAPFAAWLARIAANAIADDFQSVARERQLPPGETAENPDFDAALERARLFRLVDALPADQGRVLRLRFAEQRSIREIAAELGRSEGAVKQLQLRGLENLRMRLGESHG
jgi:RNA polymerase sigma-70 factor (ECF subfamily)